MYPLLNGLSSSVRVVVEHVLADVKRCLIVKGVSDRADVSRLTFEMEIAYGIFASLAVIRSLLTFSLLSWVSSG